LECQLQEGQDSVFITTVSPAPTTVPVPTNCLMRVLSLAQWPTPAILALRRLRQEDHKFQASLDYIARSCLKKKNQNNKTKSC
jgi:hypothetical protein